MSKAKIRVGVIENDSDYLEKLSCYFQDQWQIELVKTWQSAENFWHDSEKESLDVLLIDVMLGGMTGIDLALVLNEKYPKIKKIIITNILAEDKIIKAVKNGCLGYVLKSELTDLIEAIKIVAEGGAILSPMVALQVLSSFRKGEENELKCKLTDKEMQTLELIAMGHSAAEVAGVMGVALSTIRSHIKRIHQKLNVRNVQEMMQVAMRMGLL